MKLLISGAAAATLVMTVIVVGCSEDKPTTPPPVDTNYVRFVAQEKFKFNSYNRDSSNQRIDSTKLVKVWTVLKINQSIGDRTGVAMIEEVNYDNTGTNEIGQRDTLYMQATSEGEVWQYNLLRSIVKRIPFGETFLDSVPPKWIMISNTKAKAGATWDAIDGGKIANTVAIGTVTTTVTLAWNAVHAGAQSVTVPAGTYPTAVHTDHKLVITTSTFSSKDTFNIAYDFSAKDGVLRQTLNTAKFLQGTYVIPGVEMELVSVTRP